MRYSTQSAGYRESRVARQDRQRVRVLRPVVRDDLGAAMARALRRADEESYVVTGQVPTPRAVFARGALR